MLTAAYESVVLLYDRNAYQDAPHTMRRSSWDEDMRAYLGLQSIIMKWKRKWKMTWKLVYTVVYRVRGNGKPPEGANSQDGSATGGPQSLILLGGAGILSFLRRAPSSTVQLLTKSKC